ncbi:hypothetical protein Bcep18194_C7318 [Burkholderia lata]|uniref:Uncharacterized protein n=1 Tax=Burkholderia lata (strain ATCC 17760 / DSM 23089 / LMG 22485 / NCIMB 9086 / R18194 / 383) TaxID=482957 RepID=Q39MF4_BURL3|nr:hypothetical protein Bcep18194_C7318 [Burkholderia lata]
MSGRLPDTRSIARQVRDPDRAITHACACGRSERLRLDATGAADAAPMSPALRGIEQGARNVAGRIVSQDDPHHSHQFGYLNRVHSTIPTGIAGE